MRMRIALGLLLLGAVWLLWGRRPEPDPAGKRSDPPSAAREARLDEALERQALPGPGEGVRAPVRYHDSTTWRQLVWADDEARVLLKDGAAVPAGLEVRERRGTDLVVKRSFEKPSAFRDWAREASTREGVSGVHPVFYPSEAARRAGLDPMLLTEQITAVLPAGMKAGDAARRYGLRVLRPLESVPNGVLFAASGPFEALAAAEVMLQDGFPTAIPGFSVRPVKVRAPRFTPNDPMYAQQWHLNNTGQSGGASGEDVRAPAAWDLTRGSGVVIGILDDGIMYTHPDLSPNYLSSLGLDVNFNDADPFPTLSDDDHGTAVSGVAAAKGNNSLGVSGSAPDASLAGIRILSGSLTPSQIEQAMLHRNDAIHVKSNSWGFFSNSEPARLDDFVAHFEDLAAIATGASTGRGGKGVIYTFAAGNGFQSNHKVTYSAYCNLRHVIAVGAVTDSGVRSLYSETGPALLVCAPSSGGSEGITTTDRLGTLGYNTSASPGGDYDNGFGGTSSSTPLVSGVIALMLARNPDLGWRDVQHVLVRTSRKNNPAHASWKANGTPGGRQVSEEYGHGVPDAAAAVALGSRIGLLPAETLASASSGAIDLPIVDTPTTGTYATATEHVLTLNHSGDLVVENVEVVVNITHTYRGDLRIRLTSPSGMEVTFAEARADSVPNYASWQFKSALHWGALANGDWKLSVDDGGRLDEGDLNSWTLRVYGTPPDSTPPSAGTVNDGTGADAAVLVPLDRVTANWSGFADAEAPALGYEMQLELLDGTVVRAFTGVGYGSPGTLTGLSLVPGTSYRVRVRAMNATLGTAESVSNGFVVAQPAGAPAAGPSFGNTGTVTLSWTPSAHLAGISGYTWTVERRLNGGTWGTTASGLATPSLVQSSLAEGSYEYRVLAVAGGGEGARSAISNAAVVDTTSPNTTITLAPTNPSGESTPTFFFSSNDGSAVFEYRVDGGAYAAAGPGSQTLAPLAMGSHTFEVRAVDLSGNVDPSPASFTWTVNQAPVDGIAPWINNLDLPWSATNWTLTAPVGLVGWAVDGTPSTVPGGPARSGPASLNYNNGVSYGNGLAHSGTATSPVVSLSGMSGAVFRFMCNYQTDPSGDLRTVEVTDSAGAGVHASLSLDAGACGGAGAWHEHAIPLNVAWGSVRVRFTFSADAVGNTFAGWFVDDIGISDLLVNGIAQFDASTGQSIPVGASVASGRIDLRAQVAQGPPGLVSFEVEVVPVSEVFMGTPTAQGAGAAGSVISLSMTAGGGAYKWRARTVNLSTAAPSRWVDYAVNSGSEADFTVPGAGGGGGGGGGCGALGLEAWLVVLAASALGRRRK